MCPGGRRLGPRVCCKLQPGEPGRSARVGLVRRGPRARPCESLGTRMLRRAPGAGRRREHLVGSHCRARPSRGPGAGLMAVRQVPSESVAQGAATAHQVGGKWVPCVEPLRPVSAGLLCVQLVRPQVCFRSAGALWAAMSGVRLPGHRPGGRLPSGPASSVRPSPQQWRASGAGDAVGVRGAWVVQLPAAVARATR